MGTNVRMFESLVRQKSTRKGRTSFLRTIVRNRQDASVGTHVNSIWKRTDEPNPRGIVFSGSMIRRASTRGSGGCYQETERHVSGMEATGKLQRHRGEAATPRMG